VFAKPVYTKRTRFFSVFATTGDQSKARLGIVVAKRNVKLAVERNKLKRLIRESFRRQQEQLSGLDVVVVVKQNFNLAANEKNKLPEFFNGVGDKLSRCYNG
jgi:ribonuclease P protein component